MPEYMKWLGEQCVPVLQFLCYEVQLFYVQSGMSWDPDIVTFFFFVTQTDLYGCYFFIHSSAEELLFFSALTHLLA